MTREETMSVIAKGVNPDSVCPLIEDIGRQAAYGFELAREYAFKHDEDEILLDLMMRLYIDDKYMCMPNWCRNGVEGRRSGNENWCRSGKGLMPRSLKKVHIFFNIYIT